MRVAARGMAAILGVLGAGLLSVLPAQAAGAGVDDVVAALGLTTEPADYVVLVDTSGSMKVDDRYVRVRQELGRLVRGLDVDDRVSLLTFDTTVTPRFRGKVGKNPGAVLAGLPAEAAGTHTDIGTAIAAGLSELEQQDTRRLAALILITDGVLDAPGSPYKNVKSSAWKKLRTRASDLSKDHQVAAYAVSLQATTDAGLLKKVLPQAREIAADQVGERFAQVGKDVMLLQAKEALQVELAQPIGVTWTGDLGAALASGVPTEVELELASPYTHVPVQLSRITATAPPGLEVQLTGLPDKVKLAPGGRVRLPATVTVTGTPGADANVGLQAKVTSSWSDVLTEDLGLEFAPALTGSAPVPTAPITLPPTLLPTVGGIAALAVGVLLVLLLARMLLVPTMSGVLTIRRDGRDLADVVLRGRKLALSAPPTVAELAGLGGSVTGARGSDRGERAVRIDAKLAGATVHGVVADGGSVALGELEVTYTSGRRRILEKIGFAEPEPEPEAQPDAN